MKWRTLKQKKPRKWTTQKNKKENKKGIAINGSQAKMPYNIIVYSL